MAHSVFMFELFPPSILLVSDPAYFPVKRRAGENQRGRQSHRTRWHPLSAEHQGEDEIDVVTGHIKPDGTLYLYNIKVRTR